jgi:hypothetical protein
MIQSAESWQIKAGYAKVEGGNGIIPAGPVPYILPL